MKALRLSGVNRARRPYVAAVLGTALLAAMLCPSHAQARLAGCRADPILQLSNGDKVQVQVSVGADSSAVSTITYAVHVPSGTKLSKVVYTGGSFAGKEKVQFYADQLASRYTSTTTVSTATPGISVTATTTVAALSSTPAVTPVTASVAGLSNQALSAQFTSVH